MQQHPLSAAFPAMSNDDFDALKSSVEAIGVQNPVTVYDGQIIDGWHRYQAAQRVGRECPTVDLAPDVDPRAFVLAQNKARRHITQAQLAMATTAVYAWASVGKPKSGTQCRITTESKMAEIAGVGERSIRQAKSVQANAVPDVIDAVKRGEIGLPKAAKIAQLPKDQQAEAILKPLPKAVKNGPSHAVVAHDELAEMRETIDALRDENEELSARFAIDCMDATEDEKLLAHEQIKQLQGRIRTLEASLSAVTAMRGAYLRENGELKKEVLYLRRKLNNGGV